MEVPQLVTRARQQVDLLAKVDANYARLENLLTAATPGSYEERRPMFPLNHRHALDREILSQMEQLQVTSSQGVFPEVSRAWCTIDSQLFIWDLYDGSDFCVYRELDEIIVGVGLAKPKPRVFREGIDHLLVIATPIMVYVLGVQFEGEARTENKHGMRISLDTDVVYKTSTDNVCMNTIVGTEDGRIVMGGDDGCVYELVYERDPGWLSKKCRKVNHTRSALSSLLPTVVSSIVSSPLLPVEQVLVDESRKMVYARSASMLQMFFIHDGKFEKACDVDLTGSGSFNQDTHGAIVWTAVIPKDESERIGVVAVTAKGCRVYFDTPNPRAMFRRVAYYGIRAAPFTPQDNITVLAAHHVEGNLILACRRGTTSSPLRELVVVTPKVFDLAAMSSEMLQMGYRPQLNEDVVKYALPDNCSVSTISTLSKFPVPRGESGVVNLAMRQHGEPAEVVFASSVGTFTLKLARPVDRLRNALNDGTQGEVARFFQGTFDRPQHDTHGPLAGNLQDGAVNPKAHVYQREACASAMVIACGAVELDRAGYVSRQAVEAILQHGGAAQTLMGFNPIVLFSGKFQGTCQYLSRVCRAFWSRPLVQAHPTSPNQLVSILSEEEIAQAMNELSSLRNVFIEIFGPDLEEVSRSVWTYSQSRDAAQQEMGTCFGLLCLLDEAREGLALWHIIMQDFAGLVADLKDSERRQLQTLNFSLFVSLQSGELLAKSLISKLLERTGKMHSARHDMISQQLNDNCPNLFNNEDRLRDKARQTMLRVKDNHQRTLDDLKAATDAYRPVLSDFGTVEDLQLAVSELLDMQYWDGARQLIQLYVARADLAAGHACFKRGEHFSDEHGQRALELLRRCYNELDRLFERMLKVLEQAPVQSDVDPYLPTRHQMQQEIEKQMREVFTVDDELAHNAMFDWLMKRGMKEMLSKCDSKYAKKYLETLCSQYKNSGDRERHFKTLDALSDYLILKNDYAAAAQHLRELAMFDWDQVSLSDRNNYLSRAVASAQNVSNRSAAISDLIQDLKDQLDVARLQMKIMQSLRSRREHCPQQGRDIFGVDRAEYEDAIREAKSALLPLERLYEAFAVQYNLHESTLQILFMVNQPQEAHQTWKDLLDSLQRQYQHDGSKVISEACKVALEYRNAPEFVPIGELVDQLEDIRHQARLDPEDIVKGLEPLGARALLDVYHTLQRARGSAGPQLHHAIYYLLRKLWASCRTMRDRQRFAANYGDMIARYASDVPGASAASQTTGVVHAKFAKLQHEILST